MWEKLRPVSVNIPDVEGLTGVVESGQQNETSWIVPIGVHFEPSGQLGDWFPKYEPQVPIGCRPFGQV